MTSLNGRSSSEDRILITFSVTLHVRLAPPSFWRMFTLMLLMLQRENILL